MLTDNEIEARLLDYIHEHDSGTSGGATKSGAVTELGQDDIPADRVLAAIVRLYANGTISQSGDESLAWRPLTSRAAGQP